MMKVWLWWIGRVVEEKVEGNNKDGLALVPLVCVWGSLFYLLNGSLSSKTILSIVFFSFIFYKSQHRTKKTNERLFSKPDSDLSKDLKTKKK